MRTVRFTCKLIDRCPLHCPQVLIMISPQGTRRLYQTPVVSRTVFTQLAHMCELAQVNLHYEHLGMYRLYNISRVYQQQPGSVLDSINCFTQCAIKNLYNTYCLSVFYLFYFNPIPSTKHCYNRLIYLSWLWQLHMRSANLCETTAPSIRKLIIKTKVEKHVFIFHRKMMTNKVCQH